MPLTKRGRKMLHILQKEYGKIRGKRIFYSMAHKMKGWHRKRR